MHGSHNHFTSIDWIVLVVYFCGTMSIGFYFYRKSRSSEGFMAAGRSLPGWACGLSIFATYLSSISFLALPGNAFSSNWNAFVFSLSLPIAAWIAVRFFLPYYRASGEVSAYAMLEHRFGPWARFYASFFYLMTQLARMGVVMYLMALPLSVLLGWDIRTIIFVTGISVTVYTFVGGIVAVIWSDALQAIVLMAGAALCSVLMLFRMPDGPGQMMQIALDNHKFSLGGFGASLAESTFWVVLVYGIAMNLQNFGIDQSYIQRYIASKSDREARKSVWLGGLLYVPVSAVFFFIGTQLFAFYKVNPDYLQEVRYIVADQRLMQQHVGSDQPDYAARRDAIAQSLTTEQIGDRVFPHFIGRMLPPGLTGLLIAAIFAAAMSTVSTSLNSSATLLTTDWYKRCFKPAATEKQTMLVCSSATVIWGILGTLIALILVRLTESALDIWWTLSGIFSGGMLGLFLLGIISRKATNPVAIVSVLCGIFLIVWMTLSPQAPGWLEAMGFSQIAVRWAGVLQSPFHRFLIPVFGTATILFVGLLMGCCFNSVQDATSGQVNKTIKPKG